jgi:Uncharacterised protein family (UPF0236)
MKQSCALQENYYPVDEAREMTHKAVDQWFDTHIEPLFRQAKPPTMAEISKIFQDSRQEFLAAAMQSAIERLYEHHLSQKTAPCPKCNKILSCKRTDEKNLSTLQGEFSLLRPYYYCKDCGHGFHPVDKVLELARERHQYDIQAEAVRLGADLPFQRSSEHIKRLTGVNIGGHFSHKTLHAVGEQATLENVIPSREYIEQRISEVKGSDNWRPMLVVSCDGAYAPIRPPGGRSDKRGPGNWQDAKGVRIYLLGKDSRIIHIVSWHQVEKIEAFTADLQRIAERIPQAKVRIALLGDGASWLWNAMRSCFPKGREILDFYHCSEYLHAVANAQYGETMEAREWVEASVSRLFLGEATLVVAGLRRMKPINITAEEAIETLIGYLGKRLEQVDYGSARRAGAPIGSGGIESANKFICHARLKISGAWWLKENSNSMLRVRCALYNGTFDQIFDIYKKSR